MAPASSTNDAAIWVTAKTRSRRLVLPVIRGLPLPRPMPRDVPADGRRGTNASSTAATTASAAPTQSRLESTVRSSARTEKREAYRARMATIGCAISTPSAAPAPHSSRLSASSVRRSAPVLAPSAARIASSPSRRTVRARTRLATFEHAMMKTRPAAASSTSSTVLAFDVIWSRSRTALMRTSAFAEYASGCCCTIEAWTARSSARADSSVAPGASRPNSSVMRWTRPCTMVAER